jgi:NTP pyrophosphatase (non-canonical NTP hydrolase)
MSTKIDIGVNGKIDFEKYQNFVAKLASKDSTKDLNAILGTSALGLVGEAGEVAEIAEDMLISTSGRHWNKTTRDNLIKELGDAMWYITFCAQFYFSGDLSPRYVAVRCQYGDLASHGPSEDLTNGSVRLSAVTSKFADTVKKILYHGMPVTEAVKKKLSDLLNDTLSTVLFLVDHVACCDLLEVVQKNVDKLSDRYKSLEFSTEAFMKKENSKEIEFVTAEGIPIYKS